MLVAELNGDKVEEISKAINHAVNTMMLPKGNRILMSFWTNDLKYFRIYPDEEFYDYVHSNHMFTTSTVNHIRNINSNADLEPAEFWSTDQLSQNYTNLCKALKLNIPVTYVRVFNEGKLIFQFVKYQEKMPINLINRQSIKLMIDLFEAISPIIVEALPILNDTQFSINSSYRKDIIQNIDTNKRILTELEKKTLYWLSVGKTLEDIAIMYDNKPSSVKSRMSVIRDKLNASTNIQAVASALKFKLL